MNARASVGLGLARIHESEVASAQQMHGEMSSLVAVLRDTQEVAENRAASSRENEILAQRLDDYSRRLVAQGQLMIGNAEQYPFQLVLGL